MGEIDQVGPGDSKGARATTRPGSASGTRWPRIRRQRLRPRGRQSPLTAGTYYLHAGVYHLYPSASSRPAKERTRATAAACIASKKATSGASRISSASKCRTATNSCRRFHEGPGCRKPKRADRVLRRAGSVQGNEHAVRRRRTRQPRHQHARDRRTGAGRGAAAARYSEPLRLRSAGHRGVRLRGGPCRCRSEARRGDGVQPGRLLRAAHRGLREALRGMCRVGCALRLPRQSGLRGASTWRRAARTPPRRCFSCRS